MKRIFLLCFSCLSRNCMMKKNFYKIILLVASILISVSTNAHNESRYGGTLKVGLPCNFSSMYPWDAPDIESFIILQNVYE